ncbi:hypothetical protein DIV18_23410 [Escherichia coli]|uniref:DUF551 domain-containing protein n=1 Tax=Escherichia coli TaxID=562 RepID=UPI000DAC38C7|nr:DUF551 domain-containing protein [Escherichia coli]PZY02351.1 hypothetical protein DIV18_23410 [Escherichia coli]
MTTFTKDRLLTIQHWRETYGPGSNVVLPAEEAEELARIALASLEAEPVAKIIAHYPLGVDVGKQKFVQAIRELPDFGGYLYRDADLRWIHGVIVQAAWFVKASLEQNALSGNYPVTPDSWISCSERMPKKNQNVLISVNFDSDLVEPLICSARYTGSTFRRGEATIKPGNGVEQVTHWMPLPEPPQEVNRG